MRGDFNELESDWLCERVPIDPLLKTPLDIYGDCAQRRHQIRSLARQLSLEHRLDNEWGIRESSWRLLFNMLEPLADAVSRQRIDLQSRASWVAAGDPKVISGGVAWSDAAIAALDFGWGHMTVRGGELREVLPRLRQIYILEMRQRSLRLLRRWQKAGWVSDVGHRAAA